MWTDITAYVLSSLSASYGQQTEIAQPGVAEQGQATLSLMNNDHRFTMGNPTGPYYPYWVPGIGMRIREQVDGALYDIVTGVLELPKLEIRTPGVDQVTSVTIVDRWSALSRGRPFTSALADWILHYGGSTLKGYWPLTDAAAPFGDLSSNGQPSLRDAEEWATMPSDSEASVGARQGEGPPGGELGAVLLTAATDTAGSFAAGKKLWTDGADLDIPLGDCLTAVAWFDRVNVPTSGDPEVLTIEDYGVTQLVEIYYNTAFSRIDAYAQFNSSAWTATAAGRDITGLTCVAVRVQPSTNTFELWIDDDVYTGTPSGSAPAGTVAMDEIYVGNAVPSGSYSHAQVYVGASTAWGQTEYLAQLEVGREGLAGQTVTERLTTLATLRELSAADYAFEDTDTRMPAAAFADQVLTALWSEAVKTDYGQMFVDPSGVVRFQSRTRRYYT